jgi:hypothetical protein
MPILLNFWAVIGSGAGSGLGGAPKPIVYQRVVVFRGLGTRLDIRS